MIMIGHKFSRTSVSMFIMVVWHSSKINRTHTHMPYTIGFYCCLFSLWLYKYCQKYKQCLRCHQDREKRWKNLKLCNIYSYTFGSLLSSAVIEQFQWVDFHLSFRRNIFSMELTMLSLNFMAFSLFNTKTTFVYHRAFQLSYHCVGSVSCNS